MRRLILFVLISFYCQISFAQVYGEEVICGGGWCEGDTVYQNLNKTPYECEEVPTKAYKVVCKEHEGCKKFCTLYFRRGGSCGYCEEEKEQ